MASESAMRSDSKTTLQERLLAAAEDMRCRMEKTAVSAERDRIAGWHGAVVQAAAALPAREVDDATLAKLRTALGDSPAARLLIELAQLRDENAALLAALRQQQDAPSPASTAGREAVAWVNKSYFMFTSDWKVTSPVLYRLREHGAQHAGGEARLIPLYTHPSPSTGSGDDRNTPREAGSA